MDSEFEPKNHPSYGTVMFTRTHCGGGREKLFGSAITNHFTTVKLTIREAELRHKYHEDRIWGDRKIIEVELSAAQFVELLTTMNVGTGTPCTIRFRQDVGKIEIPPDDEIEIDHVQDSFKKDLKEMADWLLARRKELMVILEKKAIGKKDREDILEIIEMVIQEVRSNRPFALDQFNEATERVVVAAKAEVDSFVTQMVQSTGLEQLRAMKGGEIINRKALPSAKIKHGEGE